MIDVTHDISIISWPIEANKIPIDLASGQEQMDTTFVRAAQAENRRKIRKVGASGRSP